MSSSSIGMGERIVLMRWGFILFFAAHIFACFFFFISKVCCLAGLQLHRDSPTSAPELARTSAPGLAHICAGTRPHLRRDSPTHLRRDSPTSALGLTHICAGTCSS